VDRGTALEVNTSGLRHGVREPYPSPDIVALFRALGGRAVTIGSDGHRETQFAWALRDGYAAAAAAGFGDLAFRRGGEPIRVAIPDPLRA
jgi:histidinol-phosphatase (PHP family)